MAATRQLIVNALKSEDREFRRAYADSFLNSRIALQIRSNRKARGWTQKKLAKEAGMHQSQIPDLENIDNESWKISTLLKIAAAYDLVLIVKFESFGAALKDFSSVSPEELARPGFCDDPEFHPAPVARVHPETSAPQDANLFNIARRISVTRSVIAGQNAIPLLAQLAEDYG